MTIDASILAALRQHAEGVSGADLAQQLGLSRTAIWARIEALRALGYEIEASPHRGYRLLNVPDVLHADDLLARLAEVKVIGRDIQVFQETTSTNDILEKLAQDGVREGIVVFAETQTKGRGRLGRKWLSPPGKGLWFSVLLRPPIRPPSATQLVIASAVAVARAICGQTQLTPEIKWPNDILFGGKKLGGILTELHAELDSIKYLILGIGMDVNMSAQDFPPELRGQATSLQLETGTRINRADLAAALLRELDFDYARILNNQFGQVADEWEQQCTTLGRTVSIRIGDRTVAGQAEALDSDGALLLRTQHGRLERITGGDVTLLK